MGRSLAEADRTANPSPVLYGRGGAQAGGLGGKGLADSLLQTLTSHRFAAGPSSPAKSGRGVFRPYSPNGYVSSSPADASSAPGSGVTASVLSNQTQASNWLGRTASV